MDSYNDVTLVVWLGFWPVWLVWELILLRLRKTDRTVRTLSMVARDRSWQVNSVVYLWCGLGTHFWWPGPNYASIFAGFIFWFVGALLLAWDIKDWRLHGRPWPLWERWRRWARWPLLWAVAGVLSGRFLFPQTGRVPWGP